ncbi:MAG: dipeptide epimerase [Calditrichaeota bacterium]|nr:dipeptide epimerase [Calditrichota bacterium]RQW02186.1 MAG: dipeptide epimerase [Calditrichota bacterium]
MAHHKSTIIKKVKSWRENLDLTRPYTIAYQTIDSVENIFVYLETEDGLYGVGSGSPASFITGESMDAADAVLADKLEDLLKGKDIRMIRQHCRELQTSLPDTPAARMAVDIALHDILAKYYEIPLVDFLGRVHKAIPTSKTIGIKDSVEEMLSEADEHINTGFKVIKLKIGRNMEKDIEYTAKLRERVGSTIGIRVDANQGYTPRQLTEYAAKTEKFNIELIEQPLHKSKDQEMSEVSEDIRRICAADESLHNPADALKLAQSPQLFGIYNIKLMKCGGLYPAAQIADIADTAGIQLMWGCMDESIISITAGLHVAFACPATRYLDLDGSFDLARDIVSGGFRLIDGLMTIPYEPGLGVKLRD